MSAQELKPCPFCGVELTRPREGLNYRHSNEDCIFGDRVFTADQLTAWNTRATDARLAAAEAMAVALRDMLEIRAVWTDPHNDSVVGKARAALEEWRAGK